MFFKRQPKRQIGAVSISADSALSHIFVCPECGSTYFGSTKNLDGSFIRNCRGLIQERGELGDVTSCKFEWSSTDDHKYCYLSLAYVLEKKGSI